MSPADARRQAIRRAANRPTAEERYAEPPGRYRARHPHRDWWIEQVSKAAMVAIIVALMLWIGWSGGRESGLW